MKYIIVLGDGMADRPIESIGNRTPLEAANKPHIDALAGKSTVGLVSTVPEGMKPGSDVANLSVLGYDPKVCYTGRSPLEALSIGIDLKEEDIALRANLVTLSDDENFEDKTMVDYSAGEISTPEATELIAAVEKALGSDVLKFYAGVSYRHCLVWKNGTLTNDFTPPHDISGRKIAEYLPKGSDSALFRALIEKSGEVLKNHPVNAARKATGKNPATNLWFWGAGTKPALADFEKTFGLKGAMISAVDLLKGIAIGANMKSIDVEGSTGNLDTNWKGKTDAALKALLSDGYDFVYLHMEAPDEMGHQGSAEKKIKAIEYVDQVVGWLLDGLSGTPFTMAVLPDHATPVCIRTHSSEPVPFLVYNSEKERKGPEKYDERTAAATGFTLSHGSDVLNLMKNN